MLIKNRQKQRIPSNLTLDEFAKAMKQLDLSSVPPSKRKQAVFDHFMSIMADSVTDPSTKYEILASQRLRRRNV